MTNEKINRIRDIGGEFWNMDYRSTSNLIIVVVFDTVRECLLKYNTVTEIDMSIDDSEDILTVMPKSVMIRREYARKATEKELQS